MVTAILVTVGAVISGVSFNRWIQVVAGKKATEVATEVAKNIVNNKLKDC